MTFINDSGDHVLSGTAPPNVGNLMGKMEWSKMIAGCAAGSDHRNGQHRLSWPADQRRDAPPLVVGLPGRALLLRALQGRQPRRPDLHGHLDRLLVQHPRRHARPDRRNQHLLRQRRGRGHLRHRHHRSDRRRRAAPPQGDDVFAVPYDYKGACDEAPDVCLGVPYFNWGPSYVSIVKSVDGRDVGAKLGLGQPRLEQHQQPGYVGSRLRQGSRAER